MGFESGNAVLAGSADQRFTAACLQYSKARVDESGTKSEYDSQGTLAARETKSARLSRSFSRVAECLPFAAGHQFDFLNRNSRTLSSSGIKEGETNDCWTIYQYFLPVVLW